MKLLISAYGGSHHLAISAPFFFHKSSVNGPGSFINLHGESHQCKLIYKVSHSRCLRDSSVLRIPTWNSLRSRQENNLQRAIGITPWFYYIQLLYQREILRTRFFFAKRVMWIKESEAEVNVATVSVHHRIGIHTLTASMTFQSPLASSSCNLTYPSRAEMKEIISSRKSTWYRNNSNDRRPCEQNPQIK